MAQTPTIRATFAIVHKVLFLFGGVIDGPEEWRDPVKPNRATRKLLTRRAGGGGGGGHLLGGGGLVAGSAIKCVGYGWSLGLVSTASGVFLHTVSGTVTHHQWASWALGLEEKRSPTRSVWGGGGGFRPIPDPPPTMPPNLIMRWHTHSSHRGIFVHIVVLQMLTCPSPAQANFETSEFWGSLSTPRHL